MKKIIIYTCIIILTLSKLPAQILFGEHEAHTVLYLLATDADRLAAMDEPASLEPFNRSVIGFWCGAKMALEELNAEAGTSDVNVIVRDVNAQDELKLRNILSEPAMNEVDLVIAAVPLSIFPIIADFGAQHNVPVVNPFSNAADLTTNRPQVYKVMCNPIARPLVTSRYFPNDNYILWYDAKCEESAVYEKYFTDRNIPFHKVDIAQSVKPYLSTARHNVVIACTEQWQRLVTGSSECSHSNPTWILQERTVLGDKFDRRTFHSSDICFFSNCFFDANSETYKVFQHRYFNLYGALPTLESMATQGYDVTCHFVGKLCGFTRANDAPIAYSFKFKQKENGGYENIGVRLVQFNQTEFKIIQPQ